MLKTNANKEATASAARAQTTIPKFTFHLFFWMPLRIPATVNRSQAQSTFNKREIRCLWNTYDHLQSSWLAREKTGFSQFKYRFRGE